MRLIGEGGANTLMFTRDAIALAQQQGLDLVEVAPNEVPPVCKLMDYGKVRYDQTKKDRDSRKLQKQVVLKEVRFSPKIDDHDIETKSKMVRRFLDDGNKVKLTVRFKGREMAHPNLGRDVLDQVRNMLGDNLVVEAMPKMEGKSMTMVVSLKPPKNAPPRQPRPAATQEAGPIESSTTPPVEEAAPVPEAEPVGAGATAEQ